MGGCALQTLVAVQVTLLAIQHYLAALDTCTPGHHLVVLGTLRHAGLLVEVQAGGTGGALREMAGETGGGAGGGCCQGGLVLLNEVVLVVDV